MGAYLIGHNLDLGEDDDFNVVLNRKDAERIGVREGENIMVGFGEIELYADVMETDSKVPEGQMGCLKRFGRRMIYQMDPQFCGYSRVK